MTDEPTKSAYSAKDLERAKAELAKQTPENWIELQRYIHTMEQKWPEAPCSVNLRVLYPNGYDIQWTMRDFDDDLLAIRLDKLFVSLEDGGCKPEAKGYRPSYATANESAGPAPAKPREAVSPEDLVITSPDVNRDALDKGNYDTFPVELVTHMVTQGKAVPYFVIKGGHFMQFGWKAWTEVLPPLNMDEYPIGKELPAPASMRIAYLSKGDSEGKNRKVIAFLGNP